MKKTILVVLMLVMIATPSFTQEIGAEEIFDIEGTIWEVLPIGLQIFPCPRIWITYDLELGFYDGTVYRQNISSIEDSSYKDMLGFIVFSSANSPVPTQVIGGGAEPFYFGTLHPTGIGIIVVGYPSIIPRFAVLNMGLLIKTDRRFTPGVPPIWMEEEPLTYLTKHTGEAIVLN